MAVKAAVVRDCVVKGGALVVLLALFWCLLYAPWEDGSQSLKDIHPALTYDGSGRIVIRDLDLLRQAPREQADDVGTREFPLEEDSPFAFVEDDFSPTTPPPLAVENVAPEEKEVPGKEVASVNADSGAEAAEDGRLPDCIIIGARRGGTYPLLHFLSVHPQVINTSAAGFFLDHDPQAPPDLERYRSQMPSTAPGQVLIERTQDYLHRREVPKLIFDMKNSIKLIVVLRDPVQRMLSDYYAARRLAQRTDGSHVSLQYSLEDLVYNRTSRTLIYDYGGLYKSKYFKLLVPWMEWFSEKQIHFVDGDAFANSNPAFELQRVEEFLGLPPWFQASNFFFSMKKGFWCCELTSCMGADKGHHYDPLDPDIEAAVRSYFRPFNQNLFRLIGRDLGWK